MTGVSPTSFCGLPWEAWTNSLGRSVPLEDEPADENTHEKNTPGVNKLQKKDMKIFGLCPEKEVFTAVVCETCKMCVKQEALAEHYERRHSNQDTKPVLLPNTERTVLPEKSATKVAKTPSAKDKRKKITNKETGGKEKDTLVDPLLKLQSLSLEGIPLPPLKVKPPQPASAPVTPSASSKVRTVPLKQREYNPDKHCGVVNLDTMTPCTWSLTCKSHSVSLRRAVTGRSKPFNRLLDDQRKAKEALTKQKKSLEASNTSSAAVSPQLLTLPSSRDKNTHPRHMTTNLAARKAGSIACSLSRNIHLNQTSSPVVTTPLPSTSVLKQNVQRNLNLGLGRSLSWPLPELKLDVTPAKRIYLSSQPSGLVVGSSPPPAPPVLVSVSPNYQPEPPRPLSVATPMFATRKIGGLLYSDRRMQTVRQGVQSCMYRARSNTSSSCPRF